MNALKGFKDVVTLAEFKSQAPVLLERIGNSYQPVLDNAIQDVLGVKALVTCRFEQSSLILFIFTAMQ